MPTCGRSCSCFRLVLGNWSGDCKGKEEGGGQKRETHDYGAWFRFDVEKERGEVKINRERTQHSWLVKTVRI